MIASDTASAPPAPGGTPRQEMETLGKAHTNTHTLGVVSFLNARPLIEHLLGREDLVIRPAVPSALSEMLARGDCAAALMPIVDFFRARGALRPLGDACIASDGETMTVRVYSRVPPDRVRRLCVDGDSHTSVILAQVVWRELYGAALEIAPHHRPRTGDSQQTAPPMPRDAGAPHAERPDPDNDAAVLLIGDKVVTDAPRGFGFEVDLGAAWKHLTGLPFVFAAWYGPKDSDLSGLATVLDAARDRGVADAERIARERAGQHGWPIETAVTYLRDVMKYRITPDMREAIERFFALAGRHGVL